jgi:hypothetical protein
MEQEKVGSKRKAALDSGKDAGRMSKKSRGKQPVKTPNIKRVNSNGLADFPEVHAF